MIAGWTVFGAFYLATVGATAITTVDVSGGPDAGYCFESSCYSEPETDPRVYRLYIPVVGPFMAIPAGWKHGIRSLIALPGVLQLSALTMAIVGTVQYVRDGRLPQRVGADGFRLGKRLRLGVAPTRFLDGGTLVLGARF
ncbi:hypothetical protein [Nannocystis pusilla]|uniref:Uncharacterized protein n=1 Tax=Nannocystis pusilla TaxID=889268 RepID=A0ABS7U3J0_9BACT|nr:hypothetical protein [Nannocystis pusilla]MBZ5714841.1 hypothetical protein [Nannocystis pusilla]